MSEAVELQRQDRWARLRLNRPERLNAFDLDMARLLEQRLQEACRDPSLGALVITGEGKGFCAGADLHFLSRLQEQEDTEGLRELVEIGARIFRLLRETPVLVIAAVNGAAAGGGCGLALSCDWRIASETATFTQAFVRIGMHPDWGSYWALPRLVGWSKALELMSLGEVVPAAEALRLGMIQEVVAPEKLQERAAQLAQRLAQGPRLALELIKRGLWLSFTQEPDRVLQHEVEGQIRCFLDTRSKEGIRAFLEKRAPRFDRSRD